MKTVSMELGSRYDLETKKNVRPADSTNVVSESREGINVETVHNPDFLDLFADSSEFDFEQTIDVNNIVIDETVDELIESLSTVSREYERENILDSLTNSDVTLESSAVPTCPLDVYLNDGKVAGPSGLGREPVLEPEEVIEEVTEEIVDVLCESDSEDDNNDQGEAPVYVETVETLSVTLVTTRLYVGEELVSERRQHTFESSFRYQPDNIDWMIFFLEICKRK